MVTSELVDGRIYRQGKDLFFCERFPEDGPIKTTEVALHRFTVRLGVVHGAIWGARLPIIAGWLLGYHRSRLSLSRGVWYRYVLHADGKARHDRSPLIDFEETFLADLLPVADDDSVYTSMRRIIIDHNKRRLNDAN